MEKMNAASFKLLWNSGLILQGDVLLFDYSSSRLNLVHHMIRSVQCRLLRDLGAEEIPGVDAYRYSHAAVAMTAPAIMEMTTPVARVRWVPLFRAGTRIMVRRPRHLGEDITAELSKGILEAAWRDVAASRRYPYSELVIYWLWSWGLNKLLLGRKFAEVFRSDRADVCSGSVWRWCVEAGLFRESSASDLRSEAWYPARLAVDENRFRTVGVWKIVEKTADAGPATLTNEHQPAF